MAYTFPIQSGHILTFARAVGDTNPLHLDSAAASESEFGALIAPPTFVVAGAHFDPDFRFRPRPGQPWMGSGRTATGTPNPAPGQRVLHGEQEFVYHRPVRAGETLSVESREGDVTHKRGRSGPMRFRDLITEYRDDTGELVVTARAVIVEFEEAE